MGNLSCCSAEVNEDGQVHVYENQDTDGKPVSFKAATNIIEETAQVSAEELLR